MKNTLLVVILLGISINCYSSEILQANINQCDIDNNTTIFIVHQSEPEIMPFINNHYFVIKQLDVYYNNDNIIIKKLKHIKNSVVRVMGNKLQSNTNKNYNIIAKFNDYINILNDLKQDNNVSKTVIKEIISHTENAVKSTKRELILLDKIEI